MSMSKHLPARAAARALVRSPRVSPSTLRPAALVGPRAIHPRWSTAPPLFGRQQQQRSFLTFLTASSPSSANGGGEKGFRGGQGGPEDEVVYFEEKTMPYSPRQLYAIVADVPSYAHFLPFCLSSSILPTSPTPPHAIDPAKTFEVDAELRVGFWGFREGYTSRVKGVPFERVEAIASSTPLFKTLITTWTFEPSTAPPSPSLPTASSPPPSTLVTLSIRYAFNNSSHATASRLFLGRVSGLMVGAFEKRVGEMYGSPLPSSGGR